MLKSLKFKQSFFHIKKHFGVSNRIVVKSFAEKKVCKVDNPYTLEVK